ncbi:hypothetical protein AB0269_10880 [Microbacterium sp. NPDC077644]|uniref:hypothetical protein n=1 Tax=Microbacterium sp. NPDC077644 TaxID=3155055 RepID=UPI00344C99E5
MTDETPVVHEVMSVDDVLALVGERRPAASHMVRVSDGELTFVMYDAFSVRGAYDDYGRGGWGFSIALGDDASVSRVFGQRLTLCGTRDAVRGALDATDRYARLRLGAEYLAEYEAAYGR